MSSADNELDADKILVEIQKRWAEAGNGCAFVLCGNKSQYVCASVPIRFTGPSIVYPSDDEEGGQKKHNDEEERDEERYEMRTICGSSFYYLLLEQIGEWIRSRGGLVLNHDPQIEKNARGSVNPNPFVMFFELPELQK
jgi:hypothetical protein